MGLYRRGWPHNNSSPDHEFVDTRNENVIGAYVQGCPHPLQGLAKAPFKHMEEIMKIWSMPQVREQEVGLEVTSYLPAEIDIV